MKKRLTVASFSAILLFCLILNVKTASAQQRDFNLWLNDVPLVADSSANKLYVTIEPEAAYMLKGKLKWNSEVLDKVIFKGVELVQASNNFSVDWSLNTNTITITDKKGEEITWKMVFTTLPIVMLESDQDELYEIWKADNEQKSKSYGTFIDARHRTENQAVYSSPLMMKVRGVTSAGKAKKSFAVELVDEVGNENDIHLFGYREDGDWILDAMYNDMARMRNRILFDLWNSIEDLPYEKDNKYQANGTQGEYVELFLRGRYRGLYCFTDKIDRKKLNLKKTVEQTATTGEVTRGLLWKATFLTEATTLYGYETPPPNDTLVWENYWEQNYPEDRQNQGYFQPIADAIDMLKRYSPTFDKVESIFYMDNVIDYIICTQAFQLMDNLQKNYYLSVRNITKEKRLLITPWDLDSSLGRDAGGDLFIDDPKWYAWGEKLGGINNLVFRMSQDRPNNFQSRLNNRWQYLKTHTLSLDSIKTRMLAYADNFVRSGAWEREKEFLAELEVEHPGINIKIANSPYDEVDFIMSFLTKNYEVFDTKVASWNPDPYTPPETARKPMLYVVAPSKEVEFEGNVATVAGNVKSEPVEGIVNIDFADNEMTISRANDNTVYNTYDVQEVVTTAENLFPSTVFIPQEYKDVFTFDTKYGNAITCEEESNAFVDGFAVQRSIYVEYNDTIAKITGNTSDITIVNNGDSVTIDSPLEGTQYIVSGESANAHITINGSFPTKISLNNAHLSNPEGQVLTINVPTQVDITTMPNTNNSLSGIYASNNVVLSGKGVLQLVSDAASTALIQSGADINVKGGVLSLFTSGKNSRGFHALHDVNISKGSIYVITTGESVEADDHLTPTAVRAIMAENDVLISGGKLFVKTIGVNGGLGIAALDKIKVVDGDIALACYDDPINAVNRVEVSGGNVFASSLVDDGMDSNGSFLFSGGSIFVIGSYPNEGAFDNDGKTFVVDGGTVIGIGAKSDYPTAGKSSQPYVYIKRGEGMKKYVSIFDETNVEIAKFETPAYIQSTILLSSPKLVKGKVYSLMTSDNGSDFTKVTDLTAQ